MAVLMPLIKASWLDDNGNPLSGGKVYTYISGTNTPANTYSDVAETSTNTNPIILDSRGEADIYLDSEIVYKFVIDRPNDTTIYTVDPVSVSGGGSGTEDGKVKISATDPVSGFLASKLIEGNGVELTITESVSGDTLTVSSLGKTSVTSGDSPDYLENKIIAGSGISISNDGSSMTINVDSADSSELIAFCRNDTGSTIFAGTPVSVNGVVGQTPTISLAQADSSSDPNRVIGITDEDIANNSVGEVCIFGMVEDIDTSSFAENTILYISDSAAGEFTSTAPSYPNYVIECALVLYSHPTQGKIMVRVNKNGFMPDVGTTEGDLAYYDGSAWQRLGVGSEGQKLESTGTLPAWQTPISTIAERYSGWEDDALCTSTYDWTTRTTTISGTSKLYYRGKQIWDLATDGDFVTSAHDTFSGSYFYYSTDGVNFQWGTSIWDFEDVIVTFASYDSTSSENSYGLVETHTIRMDPEDHKEFHQVRGTYRVSGGTIGGYTLGSSTLADRRPSVTQAIIKDEDIETTVASWADNGPYTTANLLGSAVFTTNFDQADIGPIGNTAQYNLNTGGTWTVENVPNGKHCNYWLLALPVTSDAASQKHRYKWVMGQSIHDTLAGAQQESPLTLAYGNLGELATEFVIIGVVRVHQSGGNWTIDEVASIETSRSAIGSSAGSPPITDHGELDGLSDDDHSQYLLLAGRGGQTIDDDVVVLNDFSVGGAIGSAMFEANVDDGIIYGRSLYVGEAPISVTPNNGGYFFGSNVTTDPHIDYNDSTNEISFYPKDSTTTDWSFYGGDINVKQGDLNVEAGSANIGSPSSSLADLNVGSGGIWTEGALESSSIIELVNSSSLSAVKSYLNADSGALTIHDSVGAIKILMRGSDGLVSAPKINTGSATTLKPVLSILSDDSAGSIGYLRMGDATDGDITELRTFATGYGNTSLNGKTYMYNGGVATQWWYLGDSGFTGDLSIAGDISADGDLDVGGSATFGDTIQVDGRILLNDTTGNTTYQGVWHQSLGVNRWFSGMVTNRDYAITRINTSGSAVDVPLIIAQDTGDVSITNDLDVGGDVTTTNRIQAGNFLADQYIVISRTGGEAILVFTQDSTERGRIFTATNALRYSSSLGHSFEGADVSIDNDLDVGGDIGVPDDGTGITFNGNARVYKKAGSGLKIVPHSDLHGIEFYQADGTTSNMIVKAGDVTIANDLSVGGSTVNMANLPTSATGLSTGDIWNDSGTLKIA